MGWLACCLAALAVALVLPDPPGRRALGRLGSALPPLAARPGSVVARRSRGRSRTRVRWWYRAWCGIRGARRSARVAADRRAAVIELCDVLAAELRAGKAPRQALELFAASGDSPGQVSGLATELAPVVAASRLDADVVVALRAVTAPGTGGLTQVAAAWEVAESSGAALADLLDRIAHSLRADASLRREVAAQLAAPRATARLLVGLPVFGLALGSATGMNPLEVLVTTPYGWACLGAGVVLAGAGVWWVERLAANAERYAGGDR